MCLHFVLVCCCVYYVDSIGMWFYTIQTIQFVYTVYNTVCYQKVTVKWIFENKKVGLAVLSF